MTRLLLICACLGLAACGADGEPVQPDASIAIGVSPNGVDAGASIGLTRGPLRIGTSLF